MWGEKETNHKLMDRVKRIRNFYGVSVQTVEDISVAIGHRISAPAINRWETGRSNPTADMLLVFANIFGIDMYWLLGQTDEPFNESVILNIERITLPPDINTYKLLSCKYKGQDLIIYPNTLNVTISDDYVFENNRREKYSLEDRSALIFEFNRFKFYISKIGPELYESVNKEHPTVYIANGAKCMHVEQILKFEAMLKYLNVINVNNTQVAEKVKHLYDFNNL